MVTVYAAQAPQLRRRGACEADDTEENAIQVDLTKESVRLPLYRGEADGKTVWFVLLDASDAGLAHDLGVNYAPSSPTWRSAARPACRR